MSKKIKYGLLILLIIVLALLAYLFIFNKLSKKAPAKIESPKVSLTEEQLIAKISQEQKANEEETAKKIKLAQEDVAQRIQAAAAKRAQEASTTEATSSAIAASSTKNTNVELKK